MTVQDAERNQSGVPVHGQTDDTLRSTEVDYHGGKQQSSTVTATNGNVFLGSLQKTKSFGGKKYILFNSNCTKKLFLESF